MVQLEKGKTLNTLKRNIKALIDYGTKPEEAVKLAIEYAEKEEIKC